MTAPKPPEHIWTELDLTSLTPDEYDFQEYKGSALVHHKGLIHSELHQILSKQVSAFANGAGGRLFLGVDDGGHIDGGVPIDLKRGGTRSWLEDIIAGLVDPPLASFNVHEVLAEGPDSRILPGHAVYVLEIPASPSAPHQSLDHRYYLRIAGKSRPMGHVHLQDVLRRARHPRLELRHITPFGQSERITTDPRGPKVLICFRVHAHNLGQTLVQHAGIELVLPRSLVTRDVRQRMEDAGTQLTQRPATVSFFRYHPNPIFPGQDVQLLTQWVAVHGGNTADLLSGAATFGWRLYADDAPARQGSRPVGDTTIVREAAAWVSQHEGRPVPTPARRSNKPRAG